MKNIKYTHMCACICHVCLRNNLHVCKYKVCQELNAYEYKHLHFIATCKILQKLFVTWNRVGIFSAVSPKYRDKIQMLHV